MEQYRSLLTVLRELLPEELHGAIPWIYFLLVLGLIAAGLKWMRPLGAVPARLVRKNLGRDARRAAARHRTFVDSLRSRLEQLNANVEWTDSRYAELEAQVETHVRRRPTGFRIPTPKRGGLRREYLSVALARHPSQFVLLQGAPGSGKSVALRHVGIETCERARRRRLWSRSLPLYVNLRDFKPAGPDITAEDVREYIFSSQAGLNDARQIKYLRDNFEIGIDHGRWLFLFDGFDEIPEVLAAVQIDSTIRRYADALSAFASDVGNCRSIIASREYRGPEKLNWPRLEIVGLTEDRRREFIRKSNLDAFAENVFLTRLPQASASIQQLADNPMFLGLVAEHIESERRFPESSHEVFETHARRALGESDVEARFGVAGALIRAMAEEIAYCMSADDRSGLSATVDDIAAARLRLGMPARDVSDIRAAVKILTYVRITRTDETFMTFDETPISFSHRRFQEYFATCYVLDRPEIVSPRDLLLDGRWRETAVTIMQTQGPAVVQRLLDAAADVLHGIDGVDRLGSADPSLTNGRFEWPPKVLHVLSILDHGLGTLTQQNHRVVGMAEGVLSSAVRTGIVVDKKWALDVAGPVRHHVMIRLLRESLRSGSEWLRETAFRRMRHVSAPLPPDISREIAFSLVTFSVGGRLRRDRISMKAQIANLPEADRFTRALRLLSSLTFVDVLVHVAVGVLLFRGVNLALDAAWATVLAVSHVVMYPLRASTVLSWSASTSKTRRVFEYMRSLGWGYDTFLMLYLVAAVRGLVAYELFRVSSGAFPARLAQACVTAYLLSWSPACLLAIRLDTAVRGRWLIGLPQAVALSSSVVLVVARVRRTVWREWVYVVQLVVAGLAVSGALAIVMVRFQVLGAYLVAGISVLTVVAGVPLGAVKAGQWVTDMWRLRSLILNPPSRLSADEFVQLLNSFHTRVVCVRAVRSLREAGVVRDGGFLLEAMQDLAWAIEQARRGVAQRRAISASRRMAKADRQSQLAKAIEEVREGVQTPAIERWLVSRGRGAISTLTGFGAPMADEVGRSIDQLSRSLPANG